MVEELALRNQMDALDMLNFEKEKKLDKKYRMNAKAVGNY